MYICIYIHIYICIYIHIHIYIYIPLPPNTGHPHPTTLRRLTLNLNPNTGAALKHRLSGTRSSKRGISTPVWAGHRLGWWLRDPTLNPRGAEATGFSSSGGASGKGAGNLSGAPSGIVTGAASGAPSGIMTGAASGAPSGIMTGVNAGGSGVKAGGSGVNAANTGGGMAGDVGGTIVAAGPCSMPARVDGCKPPRTDMERTTGRPCFRPICGNLQLGRATLRRKKRECSVDLLRKGDIDIYVWICLYIYMCVCVSVALR